MEVDEEALLQGAHPHGYLLLTGEAQDRAPAECGGWRRRPDLLAGHTLLLQPRTVVGHARGPGSDRDVVLLGHPVDVAQGLTDSSAIASRLADTWTRSGTDALIREAADLGGRWTLMASSATSGSPELVVVPDTHATQPVHVGSTARRAAVASAPSLVAGALDLGVDERALELLDILRARMQGRVTYLPGRRTAYLGVEAVLPNLALHLTSGPDGLSARQERFWPFRPRVECRDTDAVYAAFRDRFARHTELLAGFGTPTISLTAGLDSRVTAAVAAASVRERGGFAFTYLNPRDAQHSRAAVADVTGAREVARQLGLPHRVLRWRQPPRGGTFDVIHRRTYAPLVPSRGAAHAMWADLPPDIVQLQSNGGETGTTFIRDRPDHVLTPHRLTQLFSGGDGALNEDLADELYGDYLDRVPMDAATLLGFEDYDVLYWEQRMGRWGWQKFVDGDVGHRVLAPFNDRVLLETMLSLPYPSRRDKVLFDRLLAEAAISPPRGSAPAEALIPTTLGHRARRLAVSWGRRVRRFAGGGDRPGSGPAALSEVGRPALFTLAPSGGQQHATTGALLRVPLPAPDLTLEVHPDLPHAVVGERGAWVLVLGAPCDVPGGLDGAEGVAELLHRLLSAGPAGERLTVAAERAAALCGSWTVLLSCPGGARALTDPLATHDLRLDSDGLVIRGGHGLHEGPAPGEPLGGRRCLRVDGPAGSAPWQVSDDLPDLAEHVPAHHPDAQDRITGHARLLARRGPAVLALGEAASLLPLAPALEEVEAVTFWDPSNTESTLAMMAAGDRALVAGVDQRLVLVDGAGPSDTDEALADDAVLWVGARPARGGARRVGIADAVPPGHHLAFPWSDRVLDLLLGAEGLAALPQLREPLPGPASGGRDA